MAHIRSWADIEARGEGWLTAAETQLIAACKAGEWCFLGDGSLPPPGKPAPDRELRAEVLRYLIFGGCPTCPVDDIGVWVSGAHITGLLDLDFCTAKGALRLLTCRFDQRLDTEQTRFAMVNLGGSNLNGWHGPGMTSMGAVLLDGITATDTVDLISATIAGQLKCSKAQLNVKEGFALKAQGAQVTGSVFLTDITATATVDLNSAIIGGPLACEKARFNAKDGDALNAQGAKVTGSVFLTDITATAMIDLNGATIGGSLECDKARFNATRGLALNAQASQVTGSVFLRNITATATVDLNGATIGGPLECNKARFMATTGIALDAQGAKVTGDVRLREITAIATINLNRATIGGKFYCNKAQFKARTTVALSAEGLTATEGVVWRQVLHISGAIDFNTAHFRVIADDAASWSDSLPFDLDGMTYDRIVGATDATSRLAWLAKGNTWNSTFRPQPYTQLAKVLRDMGQDGDARKVLARREQLIRQSALQRAIKANSAEHPASFSNLVNDARNVARLFVDVALRWMVGYGYYPFRSFLWLITFIFLTIFPAHCAWQEGSFAPNSGPVLTSEGWLALHASEVNPAEVWSGERAPANWTPSDPETTWSQMAPGRDWESFSRYAYAVDVVIPIIDIGQTDAWAPSTTRGFWGWHLWWLKGVLSVMGWIVTALGAAAITGIIRRD